MLKKTLIVCFVCLSGWVLAVPATAQEAATLVLKSGERVSGELIDLGGVGFTVRVSGQTRRIATNDVAVVEFTGGRARPDVLARLKKGQPVLVLRNGQVIDGHLNDVGGTRPLRITVDTPSGRRDFVSSEVAQIFLATPPGPAIATAPVPATPPGSIRVDANEPWVDSGIDVTRGDRVSFNASGHIKLAPDASSGVNGNPALQSKQYPMTGAAAGALIGKVGMMGAPFLVGSNTQPIAMTDSGRLMLGVNDDHFSDNTGAYLTTVTVEPRRGIFRR